MGFVHVHRKTWMASWLLCLGQGWDPGPLLDFTHAFEALQKERELLVVRMSSWKQG
jgi:hypothetical protein